MVTSTWLEFFFTLNLQTIKVTKSMASITATDKESMTPSWIYGNPENNRQQEKLKWKHLH